MEILKRSMIVTTFLVLLSSLGNAQEWKLNFEEAKQQALSEHKKIVMVFQGSDWCAPCMKLDREVWSQEKFKKYASDNYIMVKVDFPKRKKNTLAKAQSDHNKLLAEQYNPQGHFPYVVVLSEQAEVMGTTGYKKTSLDDFISLINALGSNE